MSRPSATGPRQLGAVEEWGEKAEPVRNIQRPKGSQVIEENVSVFGAIRGSLDVGGAAKAIRQSLDGTRRSQDQKENISREASTVQRMSVEIARISNDIAKRSVKNGQDTAHHQGPGTQHDLHPFTLSLSVLPPSCPGAVAWLPFLGLHSRWGAKE
jgi:hypothetical protein